MTLVQKSPELFLAEGSICEVGESEIETLKAAVKASAKRRARINAHPDGSSDRRMLHTGSPPTAGEKWIVSQFVRNIRLRP